MAKYNALDLAKKIVNIAGDMGFSITSLQLQKVMYYVQGNYMKAFSEKAFEEDILCWDYGPVVESVWRFFNRYGRYPIKHKFETSVELTEHEKNLIETILKEKLTMNVWDLVDETRRELPWKRANECGNDKISIQDMERFFC